VLGKGAPLSWVRDIFEVLKAGTLFSLCAKCAARETLECKTPASLSWLHEPNASSKRVTPFPTRSMACGQLWGCNAAAHRVDAPSTASSGAG